MQILHYQKTLKRFKNPVVAIGVFDGVHRAHRKILKDAVKRARSIRGTSIAVTFYPHPQREHSIYSLPHRLRLIAQLGIDVCIVIRFTQAFSRLKAEDFIQNILVGKIHPRYVYIGKNFRFGSHQKGDSRMLASFSRRYNFSLKTYGVIKAGARAISSTHIRTLITRGKLRRAQRLLLWPVSIFGEVVRGTSLATKLGFPTANIEPHHEISPPCGIYAVKVIVDDTLLHGICYIGTKPTFNKPSAKRQAPSAKHIEVHIFNFHRNIYGKYLEIQFIKKIRGDRQFPALTLLVEQVKKDIAAVKKLFSLH